MKHNTFKMISIRIFFLSAFLILVIGSDVFASEGSGDWRPLYDKGMIVFNFLILVFLFLKFAKNPLKEFLGNRKLEIAREIQRIEDEKKEWIEKIQTAQKDLNESEVRFKKIKQRIIEQGEQKKQYIINEGKTQSQVMMDMAKRKIDSDIAQAKKMLRSELVDAAMDMATKNLPNEINDKDEEKFLDQYLSSLSEK